MSTTRSLIITLVTTLTLTSGCEQRRNCLDADDPELAAWLQYVMPKRIRILEWTKPISLGSDGRADALEVIVEARDAFDDLTQVFGTFHFDLQNRPISGPIATRVAFWPVDLKSEKAMRMYRDRLSRFYHFPLELERKPLPAGRYILSVWLHLPGGQRLYDEYEFDYDGSAAPPASSS
jgi:hypothetical protein